MDGAQPVYEAPAAGEAPNLERDLSGDTQFREALLGGVSRELLDHMTLPVLMAH